MKTIYFSSKKVSIFSIFGLITALLTACGSYQNKSYYDNDGIYGSSEIKKEVKQQDQDNKYKDYFGNLKKENQISETENTIIEDTTAKKQVKIVNNTNNYWDNDDRVVIVYDNWNYGNYWGYNHNWGWNGWNSNWGWNSPFYYSNWTGLGWGYNNYWNGGFYGWNNPYFGYNYYGYNNFGNGCNNGYYNGYNNFNNHNNGYTYSNQSGNRRDSGSSDRFSDSNGNNRYGKVRANLRDNDGVRNSTTVRNYGERDANPRAYTNPRNENNAASTRGFDEQSPRGSNNTRSETTPTRSYEAPSRSESTPTRSYDEQSPRGSNNTRSETAPTRSYEAPSRSESTPTRSYESPRSQPSYGGGNAGGNSGGGRGGRGR